MVCRQFALSSVMIAQVRTASWLDDAQVQSVFHALRHDPRVEVPGSSDVPPQWDRAALFSHVMDRSRRDLDTNPIYRPQRRAGLRARLERDIESDRTGLHAGDLTALARLQEGVAESQRQLRARLQFIGASKGMSEREVTARFHELRDQAPRGRQERASEAERADLGLIPRDPRTRYALTELMNSEPVRQPQREVNRWVPVQAQPGVDNPVVEIGSSNVSNRIEARHRDGTITAWHGIESADVLLARAGADGPADPATLNRITTGRDTNRYGGWRIRCDRCGQFVGQRPHACVEGRAAALEQQTVRVGDATIDTPHPAQIRALLDQDPNLSNVSFPVDVRLGAGQGPAIAGQVQVRRFTDSVRSYRGAPGRRSDPVLDIDDNGLGDTLQCDQCHSGTCRHTEAARNLLRRHLEAAGTVPRQQAAAIAVQAVLDAETADADSAAGADATPPRVQVTPATLRLADEPEVFRQMARQGHAEGVPFEARDGVLTGLAQVEHFGIELEWTGGASGPVNELRRAGILRSSQMMNYHTGQRNGWQDWTLEHDGSVSAELVTPKLTDTHTSWTQLQQACDAIRQGGGQTHWAGSHTNIDAPNFTAPMAWRLAHLMRAHEDDLMRMGRTRQSQRQDGYRSSLADPGVAQWSSTGAAWAFGHHSMIDLSKIDRPGGGGRIEFRFPDASHDAGAIQAQVKLCAALTNYVRDHDVQPGPHRPWGTSRSEGWAGRTMALDATEFAERTAGIRGLIDTLVSTDEDRIQLAKLWGRGNYFDA